MVEDLLNKFCKELKLNMPPLDKEKKYLLDFNEEIQIILKEQKPEICVQSSICPCPQEKKEELFIHLMQGNLLGQGTGGGAIGLDKEEKFLTLSFILPWKIEYVDFKEKIEEFINYLIFWKQEIEKIQLQEKIL